MLMVRAFAISSSSSRSFAGIGMPHLRRTASVRAERSPGSRISSNPCWGGSALMIAARASASPMKSARGRNIETSIARIRRSVKRRRFC
jgi:hypothetical protein